jgi:hypothetical protein
MRAVATLFRDAVVCKRRPSRLTAGRAARTLRRMRHASRLTGLLLLIVLAATLFSCGDDDASPPACRVEVVSPNGGETWFVDSTYTVLWTDNGTCGGLVSIELLPSEGPACLALADTTENDGAFEWVCQPLCPPSRSDTSSFRIRVTALASGASDESDGDFAIVDDSPPACDLQVLSPNGGEVWQTGDMVELTWDLSGGCGRSVRLELLRGGAVCDTLAATADNSGSFFWVVAACGGTGAGADYRLRVVSLPDETYDDSNDPFTIRSACSLTLLEPSGGEAFCAGDAVYLVWQSSGACGGTVRIELQRYDVACAVIAPATANSGEYTWIAQPCGAGGEGYRIRITDPASGASSMNAEPFSIGACRLSIQAPGDGAVLCDGQGTQIQWERSVCCGPNVKIDLIRNGEVCQAIAFSTPNSGQYGWIATACETHTSGYKIRITDLTCRPEWCIVESPGTFSIETCGR